MKVKFTHLKIREFALLSVILGQLVYLLSCPQPFFKPCWMANFPTSSRLHMAHWMVDHHSLQGMTVKEVKNHLSFGDRQSDQEIIERDGSTYLITDVSPAIFPCWALLTVTFKNDRVVDQSLFVD